MKSHVPAATTLSVSNAIPTIAISAATDGFDGVAGQSRTYLFSATDPSPVDQSGQFACLINWGDGTATESLSGASTLSAVHTYATAGNFTISATISDKDGGSRTTTRAVTIRATELQGDVTAIGGTTAADAFSVSRNLDGTLCVQRGTLIVPSIVVTPGGIALFGSTASDSVVISGTADIDSFELNENRVVWNGTPIRGDGVESWRANGLGGNDLFQLNSGKYTIDGGAGSDQLTGPAKADVSWEVTAGNQGTVEGSYFLGIENLTGLGCNDRFALVGTAGISGRIDGGNGNDLLDYSRRTATVTVNLATSTATGTTGIANLEQFIGSSTAASTLVGPGTANVWSIPAEDTFSLNDQFSATKFANLTGGAAADRFVIAPSARITGTVNGAGGTDTISYEQWTDSVSINLATTSSTSVFRFSGVEAFVGSQATTDQLRGNNVATTWSIDSPNGGTAGAIRFDGIESILGGDLADSIRFTTATGLVSQVDGGLGADTLVGFNQTNQWDLTGPLSGLLNSTQPFTGIENLTGGTQDDLFRFVGGTGYLTINGGVAVVGDTFDYSAQSGPIVVDLGLNTATNVSTIAGIEKYIGTGSSSDRLIGRNVNQTWTLDSAGGTIGTLKFSGFELLNGGTLNDAFVLTTPGIAVQIDAGIGTDTLTGPNVDSTWIIDSAGGGQVASTGFTNVENLTGSTAQDWFKLAPTGQITGILNGGTGDNALDYSAWTSAVDVNLATRIGTGITGTISNIIILIGGSGDDSLVGSTAASVLIGGGGNDRVIGGGGRNLLIGGNGSDRLEGLGGDDLLIAGRTAYDANPAYLSLLLAEWKSARTYDQRIANLTGVGTDPRAIGDAYLRNSPTDTIFGDAGAVDELLGGSGRDWFIADIEDSLLDRVATGATTAERVDRAE